jgi:uncharacterized protein (TIGR03437 family)
MMPRCVTTLSLFAAACAGTALAQTISPSILTQQDSAGDTIGIVSHSYLYLVTAKNPAQPGEILTVFANGLGPTNPAVPAGTPAPTSPPAATLTLPSILVGCQQATAISSSLVPGAVDLYQVTFALSASAAGGRQPLSLSIGGKTSNTVMLPITGAAGPSINAVVNASFSSSDAIAAPGTILTVFACGLGTPDNLSLFPATSFQGLSVTFNGIPGPLFAVTASANQINVFLPVELPEAGIVDVQVKTSATASLSFPLRMTQASPGIFRIPDPVKPARKNAAALFANTAWLVIPASTAAAYKIPTDCSASGIAAAAICGQPARAGDIIQVFTTGLGKATPGGDPKGNPLATGSIAPADGNPLYLTVSAPSVTIGGVPAQVLFSGIAPGFAGLYQVNLQVPNGVAAGDDVAVKISMPNGATDTATIGVR